MPAAPLGADRTPVHCRVARRVGPAWTKTVGTIADGCVCSRFGLVGVAAARAGEAIGELRQILSTLD